MQRAQRKYQPIWERLKQRDTVLLEVAPVFQQRVRRMISKEKDQDLGFKILNEHDCFYLEFVYEPKKMQLRVRLKQRFGIEDKVV